MSNIPTHKNALVVCKAGGEARTVNVKINSNNLVVCDEWKKCPHHGKPLCEMLRMHKEFLAGGRRE